MATTITKTIGATGDYPTIQDWINYLGGVGNLVTADQIQQGQLQNAEFSTANFSPVSVTTDATRYIELTTVPGASFVDNVGVRSNALYYNAANGAGIRVTSGIGINTGAFHLHLTNLQVLGDTGSDAVVQTNPGDRVTATNCIFGGTEVVCQSVSGFFSTFNNCLIYNSSGATNRAIAFAGDGQCTFNACSIVVTSGVSIPNFTDYFSTGMSVSFISTAMFGATTAFRAGPGPGTIIYDHVASNLAAPTGTGNIGSLVYADQFVSNVNDFRQHPTTSGLHGVGVPIVGLLTDITGFTRNVATPDIGAYELAGATVTEILMGQAVM